MDTSKSADAARDWTAGVYLFSGREDPVWSLSQKHVMHLVEIWEKLPLTHAQSPSMPKPGYRGCFISDGVDRIWEAFGGIVICRGGNSKIARSDVGKVFESYVLETAPRALIPTGLP